MKRASRHQSSRGQGWCRMTLIISYVSMFVLVVLRIRNWNIRRSEKNARLQTQFPSFCSLAPASLFVLFCPLWPHRHHGGRSSLTRENTKYFAEKSSYFYGFKGSQRHHQSELPSVSASLLRSSAITVREKKEKMADISKTFWQRSSSFSPVLQNIASHFFSSHGVLNLRLKVEWKGFIVPTEHAVLQMWPVQVNFIFVLEIYASGFPACLSVCSLCGRGSCEQREQISICFPAQIVSFEGLMRWRPPSCLTRNKMNKIWSSCDLVTPQTLVGGHWGCPGLQVGNHWSSMQKEWNNLSVNPTVDQTKNSSQTILRWINSVSLFFFFSDLGFWNMIWCSFVLNYRNMNKTRYDPVF